MKIIIVGLLCMALVGCGRTDSFTAGMTGRPSKVCVDGVTYLQFTSGAAVQVDKNGDPVECR